MKYNALNLNTRKSMSVNTDRISNLSFKLHLQFYKINMEFFEKHSPDSYTYTYSKRAKPRKPLSVLFEAEGGCI